MDKLADELLGMMLSPPLLVPDEMFADGGPVSPFSKATFSASDVLLVCKRFMRVATPALYETVIVRTRAQASALQAALTRNPEFGRYVRKLRLEGAYGKELETVMALMPQVSDFCFTLAVYADDSLSALTTAFTTFHLTRVVLAVADERRAKNKMHATLVSLLCLAIPTWKKLKQFRYAMSAGRYSQFLEEPTIASALVQNTTVETVDISDRFWHYEVAPIPLETLLESASIRLIRLHSSSSAYPPGQFLKNFPPSLQRRLRFLGTTASSGAIDGGKPLSTPTSACNPFYQPMQSASRDRRVSAWSRIVSFVVTKEKPNLDDYTYSDRSLSWTSDGREYPTSWSDRRFFDKSAVRALLLVSKDIHDALLLALSRHLDIGVDSSMEKWASLLHTHTALGSQVETLLLNPRPGDPGIDFLFRNSSKLRTLRLGVLSPYSMETLGRVGTVIGTTLRTVTLSGRHTRKTDDWTTETFSADVFSGFVALECLEMCVGSPRFRPTAACDFLPNLRQLGVWQAHPSFFTMLAQFGLPKFQHLIIYDTVRKADNFLKTHGPKLVRVEATLGFNQTNLDACANLEILELSDDIRPVFAEFAHPHLRQLKLKWNGTRLISKYKLFCDTISPARFPALRDIFVAPGPEIWPSKEREVFRSSWPPMAEKLAAQGIILRDQSGGTWRPRLKLQ